MATVLSAMSSTSKATSYSSISRLKKDRRQDALPATTVILWEALSAGPCHSAMSTQPRLCHPIKVIPPQRESRRNCSAALKIKRGCCSLCAWDERLSSAGHFSLNLTAVPPGYRRNRYEPAKAYLTTPSHVKYM